MRDEGEVGSLRLVPRDSRPIGKDYRLSYFPIDVVLCILLDL